MVKSTKRHLSISSNWNKNNRKKYNAIHQKFQHTAHGKAYQKKFQQTHPDTYNKANKKYYKAHHSKALHDTYLSKAKTFLRHYANDDDIRKLRNIWTIRKKNGGHFPKQGHPQSK